jgi:hypothetical protein
MTPMLSRENRTVKTQRHSRPVNDEPSASARRPRALPSVAGLTHRQSYADILAVTAIKSLAVSLVIGIYGVTDIV